MSVIYSGDYINGIVLSNPTTQNPATVSATGFVTNTTTASYGAAILGLSSEAWTLLNLGTIVTEGGNGISLDGGGSVYNRGLIQSSDIGIYIGGTYQTVTNLGTIIGGKSGVSLEASTGTTSITSSLTNGGLISGGASATDVTNTGSIVGDVGAFLSLANSGTIVGAVLGSSFLQMTNAEGGLIVGGITLPFRGAVINSGTIVGYIDAAITNFGTIEGQVKDPLAAGTSAPGEPEENYGVILGAVSEVHGQVTNLGIIDASGGESNGVTISEGYLVNGTADASAASIVGGEFGVYFGPRIGVGEGNRVTNYGTIVGNTGVAAANGSAVTLLNAGEIVGIAGTAISFAGSHNRLEVVPGAVFSGDVEGGGSDKIELVAGPTAGNLSGLGTSFVGFATVQVDRRANWIVSGGESRFVNDGTVAAYGALVFKGVSGNGKIAVGNGDSAEFAGAAGSGQRVEFTSTGGTVLLDKPLRFAATFADFVAADTIDLAGVAADSLSFSRHQLTVTENGQAVANLRFAGHYTTREFALSPDGNGGTDLMLADPTAASFWTMRG